MFISTRKVPCNIVSDSVQSVAFAVSGVAKRIIPIRSALVFMPKPCLKMRPEERFLRTLKCDAADYFRRSSAFAGSAAGFSAAGAAVAEKPAAEPAKADDL